MVMRHELVNRSAQRPLAEQDHPVEARFFDRLYVAFGVGIQIRGVRGSRTVSTPVAASVSRNASLNSLAPIVPQKALPPQTALDRIGNLATALRHPCAVGLGPMPAISTRRVARSMTNKTANRVRPVAVHTSTVKKSAAARTPQWVCRNSCQVVRFWRSGAGSRPCGLKMLAIVPRATW